MEHCEGSIVDYYRLNSPLNNLSYGMQQIMKDYKYYKLSASENVTNPSWYVDGRQVEFKFTNKTILKDVKCWTPNEVRGSSMVELEIEDALQVL